MGTFAETAIVDYHLSLVNQGIQTIHRLNLERLKLERPNLERLNPEWTEPRMD
jgi:hypothetical protein